MFDHITNNDIRNALNSLRNYTNIRVRFILALIFVLVIVAGFFINHASKVQAVSLDNSQIELLTPQPSAVFSFEDYEEKTPETEEPKNCVSEEMVTYFRYIKEDKLPIPVDSSIELVAVCNGDMAIKWVEKLGRGKITHFLAFSGVEITYIYYEEPGVSSTEEWRGAVIGDAGSLADYGDLHGVTQDQRWLPDGIIDRIYIQEVIEWTDSEIGLIELGNQFYKEAVDNDWFYLWYASDCSPSEFRMNGKAIEEGPYGYTFKVPSEGGLLEAFYEAGHCGWYEEDTIRWSHKVQPGDSVVGTEEVSVFSLEDPDPWSFCNRLSRMRPVWQPEWIPYGMDNVCSDLWGQDDNSTLAVMAREGFLQADTNYRTDSARNWTSFVSKGSYNYTWPDHIWVQVKDIELDDTDTFKIFLDAESQEPVISYLGGQYESISSDDSDVSWYEAWGTPIVFVPRENVGDFYFKWELTQVYRIRYENGEIFIEKAAWVRG